MYVTVNENNKLGNEIIAPIIQIRLRMINVALLDIRELNGRTIAIYLEGKIRDN